MQNWLFLSPKQGLLAQSRPLAPLKTRVSIDRFPLLDAVFGCLIVGGQSGKKWGFEFLSARSLGDGFRCGNFELKERQKNFNIKRGPKFFKSKSSKDFEVFAVLKACSQGAQGIARWAACLPRKVINTVGTCIAVYYLIQDWFGIHCDRI